MKQLSAEQPGFAEQLARLNRHYHANPEVVQTVRRIRAEVREGGDAALVAIHNRFSNQPITRGELRLTRRPAPPAAPLRRALEASIRNVEKFHRPQVPRSWQGRNSEGARVGEIYQPLDRVGIYVPGGTAPLISTAVMTVTLARVAGVPEIVACTPGPVPPALHHALIRCGASEIYQVGGAQAIAAMAYGTETIRPVRKIFGPGNAYVTEAKRQVFGQVAVDLLPGPSEIAVLADGTARPAWVAADLLAQAEHGPGSQIYLLTPSAPLLEAVVAEIERQVAGQPREAYLRETLNLGCYLIKVKNLSQGMEIVEAIAPEHLSLVCKGAEKIAPRIRNCGGIFLGDWSPVAMGDYAAGPSHELPTGGAGKMFSGLTIHEFFRRTSLVQYDRSSLRRGRATVELLAREEGLAAHAASVAIRFAPGPSEPSRRTSARASKSRQRTRPARSQK